MPRTPPSATLEGAETRHAISLSLNPNIDRAPAEVNNPYPSKLCILLNHTSSKAPSQMEYSLPVDWSSTESVSKLNRWRNNRLVYWFGQIPEEYRKRSPRVRFREDEELWLMKERAFEKGQWVPWYQTVLEFNEVFEKEGRPARTANQLCKMYGRIMKRGVGVPVALGGQEGEGEDGENELEEGEIREDRKTEPDRRGGRPWEL